MMERVAGFRECGPETLSGPELSPNQWTFFGAWYLR